jgi:hypothetical protein
MTLLEVLGWIVLVVLVLANIHYDRRIKQARKEIRDLTERLRNEGGDWD